MENAQKTYDENFKSMEEGHNGVLFVKVTPDDDSCTDTRCSVAKIFMSNEHVIHTIIWDPKTKHRIDVWAIFFRDESSMSLMKACTTHGDDDKLYPRPVPMFTTSSTATMMCVKAKQAIENHRLHTVHSLLTMQTAFDITCSDTIAPPLRDRSAYGAIYFTYALSIVMAMQFYDKEGQDDHQETSDVTVAQEAISFVVNGLFKDINYESIRKVVLDATDTLTTNGCPESMVEDALHRLSMCGLTNIIALTRAECFTKVGFAGYCMEPLSDQQERAVEALTTLADRCTITPKVIKKELMALFRIGARCIERVFGFNALEMQSGKCIVCEKKMHTLMAVVGLVRIDERGMICIECSTRGTEEKPQATVELELLRQKLDEKTEESAQWCRHVAELEKHMSKERKAAVRQVKQEHAQQIALLQQGARRDGDELRDQCGALSRQLEVEKSRAFTSHLDETRLLQDAHDKTVREMVASFKCQLEEKCNEIETLTQALDSNRRAIGREVHHEQQLTRRDLEVHLLTTELDAADTFRQELSPQRKHANAKTDADDANSSALELQSLQHRCNFWMEKNAMLVGEAKVAWKAYKALLDKTTLRQGE